MHLKYHSVRQCQYRLRGVEIAYPIGAELARDHLLCGELLADVREAPGPDLINSPLATPSEGYASLENKPVERNFQLWIFHLDLSFQIFTLTLIPLPHSCPSAQKSPCLGRTIVSCLAAPTGPHCRWCLVDLVSQTWISGFLRQEFEYQFFQRILRKIYKLLPE